MKLSSSQSLSSSCSVRRGYRKTKQIRGPVITSCLYFTCVPNVQGTLFAQSVEVVHIVPFIQEISP